MAQHTYSRVELAVEQLDMALSLFLDKQSYASALTLAGAAEEILGMAVGFNSEQASLQSKFQGVERVHATIHKVPLTWAAFAKAENFTRNAVKHIKTIDEDNISIDLEMAAAWMIVRACENFDRLSTSRSAKMTEFDDWFYTHMVGV